MQYLQQNTNLQGGKYKIVRFLSSGGFGNTYEGVHTLMDTRVAIKEFFVKDFCERDEETSKVTVVTRSKKELVEKLRKKFNEEAKAVFKMKHPNIVNVLDIFEENDTIYFVMEFIDGPSLNEIIKQNGSLPEKKALKYILQVCDALEYVHSQNRLHLDIKPGNIMIDCNDNAILIDFGASKHYSEETGENTTTMQGLNTPGYAPIEQTVEGITMFTPASDIYAVGATLYKLLTGITPISSSLRASGDELKPLSDNISANVRDAVMKALAINKNARQQSITEFKSMLVQLSSKLEDATEIFPRENASKGEDTVYDSVDAHKSISSNNKKDAFDQRVLESTTQCKSIPEKITAKTENVTSETEKSKKTKWIIPLIIGAICFFIFFMHGLGGKLNSRYLSTDLDSLAYSYGVIFGAQYSNFQDKDSVVPGISMQIDDFIEGFVPAISKESASLQMSVDEASQYINQFWDKLNSTNTTPLEYNSECQKLAIAYGILFGNQYSNFSDPGVVVPDEVMNLDKFLEGFTSSIRRDNESLLIDVDNASSYVKNFSFTTHQQKIAQRKGSIEEQMRSHRPYVVDEPFWDGRILTDSNLPTIKLKQLSCIIDKQMSEDKNWYENKGLKLSTYVYPQEIGERIQIPSNIPYEYEGLMISSAFSLSSCNVYLYGNTRYADSWKKGCDPLLILITDISNSNVLHFLSFEKFQRAPKIGYGNDIQSISGPQYEYFVDQAIDWVQIEDDMMYISHGHDTYAASSCGHNAYISAISLKDYSIVWTSKPLTCNSYNFLIKGNSIITGYGFTDESHYILVLDRFTGKQVQKLTNRYPYYIFEKDDKIVVTTSYDKVYTYQIAK